MYGEENEKEHESNYLFIKFIEQIIKPYFCIFVFLLTA